MIIARVFFGCSLAVLLIGTSSRVCVAAIECGPWFNGVQTCSAGIASDVLDVVAADRQHASQWCWAASIEAVFTYYGHPVSQERIVTETWGEPVNRPGTDLQILRALNHTWTDDNGDRFAVSANMYSITPGGIAQDLAQDYPLIIGARGHAMVLTEMTYLRDAYTRGRILGASVRDPWPFNPNRRPLSGEEAAGITFVARIRVKDSGDEGGN